MLADLAMLISPSNSMGGSVGYVFKEIEAQAFNQEYTVSLV